MTGVPKDLPLDHPDRGLRLVLLHRLLPDLDAIELMKQVPERADLSVIFISGYGRDETVAKALESGAADYIVKPFSPTELVAGSGRRSGEARSPSRSCSESSPSTTSSAG